MAKEEAEIKELSKKLAQNPDSMVFVQLADAYRRAGDLERSVEVCLEGLERHPTYTTARAINGRNYMDLGQFDKAAEEFHRIEESDPENILAHRMLGQIALDAGNFAEAIARQQKVLALDPDDSTAQALLKRALAGANVPSGKDVGFVETETEEGAGIASDEQFQALKVADIYMKKRAFEQAAEVVREILVSDPGNALAQHKLKEIAALRDAGRTANAEDGRKAEEEARAKAEEEARAKAEEEARAKAEAEARAKAEAEARAKAEEEARAKAEAEARAKAEEEARAKAEEEARAKAEAEARAKAEAEARAKAEAEARAKAEARRRADAEFHDRKANKMSSEDILSVIASSADELIGNEGTQSKAPVPGAIGGSGLKVITDFLTAQGIEAALLLDGHGKAVQVWNSGNAGAQSIAAEATFRTAARSLAGLGFGEVRQMFLIDEHGRVVALVLLKAGLLVASTGPNANLGLLRVAVGDLAKRA
jgi:tetratricopeptide (TPR) repeat protein